MKVKDRLVSDSSAELVEVQFFFTLLQKTTRTNEVPMCIGAIPG